MIEVACHCGTVRVEFARKPRRLTDCNCSICRRYHPLWAYFRRGALKLRYRRRDVHGYTWGDGRVRFVRCRSCGCVVHQEPVPRTSSRKLGVNMRLADPAVIAGVRVRRLDGANTFKFLD